MKKTPILLLSTLFLLAGCNGGTEQTSSGSPLPPASTSQTQEENPSTSVLPAPELTPAERFKKHFETYKKNTLANEVLATSATYSDGKNTYTSSFFKGQVVQKNPGDITLVRSIEGNQYLEYRFLKNELVDFQKTEIQDANRKETQKKISTLFANNDYGVAWALEALKPFALDGGDKTYDYKGGVYSLVEKVTSQNEVNENAFEVTITDEAISKITCTTSSFQKEGDTVPLTSFYSFELKNEGTKVDNPNAVKEADFVFDDYEVTLQSEDGHYYIGNSYPVSFASPSKPKASVIVDPISTLLPADNPFFSYNPKTKVFKVLEAGEVDIPFISSRGVLKVLHVKTEHKPILGIRLNQEDRTLEQGSSLDISATVLSTSPLDQDLYEVSITSGASYGSLSKKAGGGYTLNVNGDAPVGSQIQVTFTSIPLKTDGTVATAVNTFTVKAKPTGGIETLLLGRWESDTYPASVLTFLEDRTGRLEYKDWMGYTSYFKFTWANATNASIADQGTFIEIDETGTEISSSTFTLLSFKLENGAVTIEFEYDGITSFGKVA